MFTRSVEVWLVVGALPIDLSEFVISDLWSLKWKKLTPDETKAILVAVQTRQKAHSKAMAFKLNTSAKPFVPKIC